jgi:hypothetical protein
MFPNYEKRDMLRVYYALNRNSDLASNRYQELYPERNQPNKAIYRRLDENLATFGRFEKPRQKYGCKLPENDKQNILQEVCSKR